MTGKGEPQHSKSLQLSVKFCSLLLAASLSTVSHHHVRLSGLGSNPRQVKTPCTRYGFHDNSITFWCRITLFHRFGAKVKTSDTKRKKGQDKITREFDLLHLQESLSYASLRKGFFLEDMHFPLFSRSHWSSRRCHSAQHPNSEQSPKVKCLNGADFEKFQGWRWRLDFFPYGKFLFAPNEEWSQGPSWCLGTLCQTSRKLTHRKLIVGYKRPKHQPVRNFLKKLKDLVRKFHSPNRMRTLVHFTFGEISRREITAPRSVVSCISSNLLGGSNKTAPHSLQFTHSRITAKSCLCSGKFSELQSGKIWSRLSW